jgi:hypothetical protein
LSGGRQFDPLSSHFFPQKGVRHLQQYPGAVARQRIRAHRAPVRQVLQYLQPLLHDGMGLFALDMGDKTDAAGIVFVGWIVKSLGEGRLIHVLPLGKKSRVE